VAPSQMRSSASCLRFIARVISGGDHVEMPKDGPPVENLSPELLE
jgi:hypothetical protein